MVLVRSRVFLYQHFLSDDEANHLISLVSATLPPPNPTERLSLLLDNARTRLNFGYCSFSSFQARAELKRSAVADNMSGKSTLSEVRTSSGTFLRKGQVRPFLLSLFG
jgi:prolyl 4-hydroxylase